MRLNLFIITLLILLIGCTKSLEQRVILEIGDSPYSADPIEYDYFIHHQVFRSVLSSLVSVYLKGEISPFLASSWEHLNNKQRWTFQIKKNLEFENGDKITTEVIYKSFCRMAFLQKKKGSKSGLLEFLVGFDEIHNINSCSGIVYDEKSITFNFIKPIENLLESISFGQYAVVHPSDYTSDGEWRNNRVVTSSSFYKVSDWSDEHLKLELRNNFKLEVGHPSKLKEIDVYWGALKEKEVDLKMATSLDLVPSGYRFFGGAESKIAFLRISSWKNKKFFLSDRKYRVEMRDKFYEEIEKLTNTRVVRSFFPVSIPGITEFLTNKGSRTVQQPNEKLNFAPFRDPPGNLGSVLESVAKSLNYNLVNPKSEEKYKTLDPNRNSYVADLLAMGTGILIEKPVDDVRYMFLSMEGIRLPDETGEIYDLLKNEVLNLQKINQLLYDQAIIWPITHFADGVLAKESLDISMLNTIHPPIDFAFIGYKK